jgi:hypothetical protein
VQPSIILDRLPKLDAISYRVGDPAKPSEFSVFFAFRINRNTFGDQSIQYSIEVVHLEVDHRLLRERKVVIVLLESGKDYFGMLRRDWKHVSTAGLYQAEMTFVPLIECLRVVRSQKYTAKASDESHVVSREELSVEGRPAFKDA